MTEEERKQVEERCAEQIQKTEQLEIECDCACKIFGMLCYEISDFPKHRSILKRLILEFGFDEVCESIRISATTYKPEYAFEKIGGILYNRKNGITW